jgi:hypothetical protein
MEETRRFLIMDLKSCRVLVTPASYGDNDPELLKELEEQVGQVVYNPEKRPLTSQEVARLITNCDSYIAVLDTIDRRVIAGYGVGVDNVALDAPRNRGIILMIRQARILFLWLN